MQISEADSFRAPETIRPTKTPDRYEEYGTVVPFVLLAPAYFTGALDLGQLMQYLASHFSDGLHLHPVGVEIRFEGCRLQDF